MSYLRFTPDEYRTIADHCRRLGLGNRHQPAFRRLLVGSLRGQSHALAARISRLGRGKLNLLYWHFRERTPLVAKCCPYEFTRVEMQLVEEACVMVPFPVRFVRPFKSLLIELFQEEWPDLARKLACLSGQKFERLYEQVYERRREGA